MRKKAQSILEYAILVAVIAAALMAMHEYVYRAVDAKLRDVQDAVSGQGDPGANNPNPYVPSTPSR